MGQVSSPPVKGISVLPVDRESGPGAGGGASGNNSIFLGSSAGQNSALSNNIVIGQGSLSGGASDTANLNGTVVVGQGNAPALQTKTGGGVAGALIIIGQGNLPTATTSDSSVLIGQGIGAAMVGGGFSQSVAIGDSTVTTSTQLGQSVAIGYKAMFGSGAGSPNGSVAVGFEALQNITSGGQNTCIGFQAGVNITNASQNTFVGNLAGAGASGGNGGGNTAIGYQCTSGSANGGGIVIGNSLTNSGDRAIMIGSGSISNSTPDVFVLSNFASGNLYPLIYGVFSTSGGTVASGNIILGSDTVRNLGGTPGTNMVKLTNGTAATGAAITGGGYFYASGGNLHWVDSSGVDSTLSFGTGQVGSASGAALTNNAGAAAGTLTNAPAAGNPTKWAPFNDNGTIRNIPMW